MGAAVTVVETVKASMISGAATQKTSVMATSTTTARVITAEMARQASRSDRVAKPVDEDRDEGRRQHAPEDDVVEHVGGGVGQVVGVGQVGRSPSA